MTELSKPVRAVLGLAAIAVALFAVVGFYNQFRVSSLAISRGPVSSANVGEPVSAAGKGGSNGSAASGTSSASDKKSKTPEKVVVVLIGGLNFRESPAPDANAIRSLDQGEKLTLVSTEENWYKVTDSKGVEGYISSNDQYSRVETVK